MAQKKAGGKKPSKKTTTAQTGGKKGNVSSPRTNQKAGSGWRPLSVLVIMTLVTAVVVLLNRDNIKNKSVLREKIQVVIPYQNETTVKPDTENQPQPAPDVDKKTDENKPAVIEKYVKVYFLKLDMRTEKYYLTSVQRRVDSSALLKNSLQELIKGPAASEEKQGMMTAVPAGLHIRNVTVKNRSAVIDVSDAIEKNAAGEILIYRIDQLVYTATQFDNIDTVTLLVNGRHKRSIGSDGLSVGGPLHRRRQ